MTDEPKKKQGKAIGGINPYGSFGGDEHSDIQTSEHSDIQTSKPLNIQTSEHSDIQTSKPLNIRTSKHLDTQKPKLPDFQTSRLSNVETVSISDVRKSKHPDWKQQTIYLPPKLIKRLKIYALNQEREISEIVAELLELGLNREEE